MLVRITAVIVRVYDSSLPAWAGYEFDLPTKISALDIVTDWTSSYTNHTLLRLTSITAAKDRFYEDYEQGFRIIFGQEQMTISGTQYKRLD